MKIGLISINAHTKVLNFASPLHTYVFQQFLKDKGFDSVIIDYKPCYSGNFNVKFPYDHYRKHPHSDEKHQKALLNKWKILYYDRAVRFDKIQHFIDTKYIQTKTCYDQNKLDEQDPKCDVYLCVTDVIWKDNPNNGFDRGFFLHCKCMEGKPKIAYSASRGPFKGYTEEREKQFFDYISSFDYISVREESLKQYINERMPDRASLVLDPVFLKPMRFYKKMSICPKKKGYVLLYLVMEKNKELVEDAVKFAQEKGLEVIELSENWENSCVPSGTYHKVVYDIGVEEWLGYMLNASYIFTNSFHCCCFSIIFQKQFYAGKRTGDKVDHILELFDLTWRRILDDKNYSREDIDYGPVMKKLKEYRKISEDYIIRALRTVEKEGHVANHQPALPGIPFPEKEDRK